MTTTTGWTLETLKEYVTERFNSSEKAVSAALAAVEKGNAAAMASAEKAILKAEASADKRAEASNEIRAAMMDQQKTFATREETGLKFTAIEQRQTEAMAAFDKRLDDVADVARGQANKADAFTKLATVGIALAAVGVSVFALLKGTP